MPAWAAGGATTQAGIGPTCQPLPARAAGADAGAGAGLAGTARGALLSALAALTGAAGVAAGAAAALRSAAGVWAPEVPAKVDARHSVRAGHSQRAIGRGRRVKVIFGSRESAVPGGWQTSPPAVCCVLFWLRPLWARTAQKDLARIPAVQPGARFAFLVDSNDGWSWAKPITGAPVMHSDTGHWQRGSVQRRRRPQVTTQTSGEGK